MKKQLFFLITAIISYTNINSASVPIDMPDRYAAEVKNPALDQIDSYIDARKREIDQIRIRNPYILDPSWGETYDDADYWPNLHRAAAYIKKRAEEDPQFLAKAKNVDHENLRTSPILLEIYKALGMPHETEKELDQNMDQRIAIADMIADLNKNIELKERALANQLNVPLSSVSQPSIKVPEQGMISRAIAYLSNLFGFNKKAAGAKSVVPTQQFTTPTVSKTTPSLWQRLRPASFQQMRQQASEAKFREYKPTASESTKKAYERERFGTGGGYQY